MKVIQLLKQVGSVCNLRSFYTSCFAAGPSRRIPFQVLPSVPMPHSPLPKRSCVLQPLITSTSTILYHQSSDSNFREFQTRQFSSPTTEMDPSLADQDMWEAYQESMEKVLAAFPDKPNKKVTAEQFQEVKQYLLSKNPFNESPLIVSDQDEHGNKQNFKEILKNRKENLLNATGFNSHQYDLAMRCITNLGSKCAKKQDILPLLIAWEKIKDGGMALKPNFISTFTYVFSLEEKYLGLSSEVATFHGLLFGVTENAVYLRIKALVSMGDPVQAETLLDKLKDDTKEGKRLRTFAPILEHYCNEGDAYSILRLWKRIREAPGAHLDAETYAMIIGSIARRGFFRHDAKPIAGLSELGLKPCGPALLDEIFNVMVEDLIEITEEAALDLYRDFMEGFSENKHQQQGIAEIPRCNGSDPQIFVGRVTIDQSTAMCPVSGANLRLFTLDSDQRKHVHDTLLKMASTQHEEFHATRAKIKKKNVKANSDFAEAELRKFSDWLVNRDGKPFTAFVDGANVAYFGQGTVRYSQILRVVQELESMGEKPLVIMPHKYVRSQFRLAYGAFQTLRPEDMDVIKSLVNEGKLYVVPAQCFDDYYWMLASVSPQNGMANVYVASSDDERFPGIRPMLVSNDQMRDHKLELLEPKLFRRWYSSHIVTYSISPFEEDEWEPRTVNFAPADSFSREIQGNPMDEKIMSRTAWHFPVSTWEERGDRFCIAIR